MTEYLSRSKFPPVLDSTSFEKFVVAYHRHKVNALHQLGLTEITMGRLHRGADLTPDFADITYMFISGY